jgi:hypothetical protein
VDRWRAKAAKAVACLGFVTSLQPRAKLDNRSCVGAWAAAVDTRAMVERTGGADAAKCALESASLAASHLTGAVETAALHQAEDAGADWSSASSSASSHEDRSYHPHSPTALDTPVACSRASEPPEHGGPQPLPEQQAAGAAGPSEPADSCSELPPEPVSAWSNNLSRVHLHRALSVQKSMKLTRSRSSVAPEGMLQDVTQQVRLFSRLRSARGVAEQAGCGCMQADDQQGPAGEPAPPDSSTRAAAALAVYSSHLLAHIYRSISEASDSLPTTLAPSPVQPPDGSQGQACGLAGLDDLYQAAVQKAACLEAAGGTALLQQPAHALQLIRDAFCTPHAGGTHEAGGAPDMLLQLLALSSGHASGAPENEYIAALQAVHASFGALRSHHEQNAESLAFKLDQLGRWGDAKSQAASEVSGSVTSCCCTLSAACAHGRHIFFAEILACCHKVDVCDAHAGLG